MALSRLKNYKDFLIQPFTLERLQSISRSTCLKPRIDEEKRLKEMSVKTLRNFSHLIDIN